MLAGMYVPVCFTLSFHLYKNDEKTSFSLQHAHILQILFVRIVKLLTSPHNSSELCVLTEV